MRTQTTVKYRHFKKANKQQPEVKWVKQYWHSTLIANGRTSLS
jgi:hypothetical protein